MPTDFSHTVQRIQGHLADIARKFPHVWKAVERFRGDRGKDLAAWPQWCFMPMAGAAAIVTKGEDISVLRERIHRLAERIEDDQKRVQGFDQLSYNHIAAVGALAPWRITQGIYVFDNDLFASVADTPIETLPSEVFYRLPEWCLYVVIPEAFRQTFSAYGFFVHLEYDVNTRKTELRFLLDSLDGDLTALILDLSQPTITEALVALAEIQKYISISREDAETIAATHRPYVSLAAYICSENADIRGETPQSSPSRPKPVKTKTGERMFPARRPTEWRIGFAIGAALRRAKANAEETESGRFSPAPHIRRAHWHSFWTGKRRQDAPGERLIVKWLPPIPVGLSEEEQITATIHQVKTR